MATPLDWDELGDSGINPRRYQVKNLFRRLGAKDDPWSEIDQERGGLDGPARTLDELVEHEAAAS